MSKQSWLTPKAQAALDLLLSDSLFVFRKLPAFPVRVERSFESALSIVTEANGKWEAILGEKQGDVYSHKFSIEGYEALSKEAAELYEQYDLAYQDKAAKYKSSGKKEIYWECMEFVTSDLYYCFLSKVFQMNDEFWEQVFDIYQGGGWPCGWEGAFPLGMFIVFAETPAQQS